MLHRLIEFAWRPFLLDFGRHFPLVVIGAGIVLLMLGRVGVRAGVPWVVRHPDARRRFRNGIALGHPLMLVLIFGFLLGDGRAGPPESFRVGTDFGPLHTRPLYWHLFASTACTVALGGFLLGVFAGLGSPDRKKPSRPLPSGWPLLAGLAVAAAMTVAGVEFVRWFRPATAYQLAGWEVDFADASPDAAGLHVFLFAHFTICILAAIACAADRKDAFVTPAMAASVVLMLLTHAYGFLAYWHGSLWPLTAAALAGVFLWQMASRVTFRHRVRGFGNAYDAPVNVADPPRLPLPPELLPLPWFDAPRPAAGALILLDVSGAGAAGAAWVNLVLDRLNREFPGFTHRVHLIAGTGGAMLGAAAHVACLREPARRGDAAHWSVNGRSVTPNDLARELAKDTLSPVVRAGLFDDAVQKFLPAPAARDRGDALEDAWRQRLGDALEGTFGSLLNGERDGWRPSLVFAPRTEDGRRVLVSNRDLGPLTYLGPTAVGWELFRVFGNQGTLPLAAAARMASGLPVLSPAAELPTVPRQRLVNEINDDGGLAVVGAWLEEALRHPAILDHVAPRILLVRIADRPAAPEYSPMLAAITRGFYELMGPDHFHTEDFINTAEAPATWFVPPAILRDMAAVADSAGDTPVGKAVTRLRAWLGLPGAGGGPAAGTE